jgi:hypothetical protein
MSMDNVWLDPNDEEAISRERVGALPSMRFTNKTVRGMISNKTRRHQSHVFDLFFLAFNGLQAPLRT